MSLPLQITATLSEWTSGIAGTDFPLDGPLSWAEAVTGDYPPLTREDAPHIPLPLTTWEMNGEWGWACSRAHYEVEAYGALELRKKPADPELVRFTQVKKNHHALGPQKARDLVVEVAWIPTITWNVETTDEPKLGALLDLITHLGGHRAIGMGRVKEWDITLGVPGAWKDRDFTPPTRPPYWHPQRRRNADT